jgi:hypothetical protein
MTRNSRNQRLFPAQHLPRHGHGPATGSPPGQMPWAGKALEQRSMPSLSSERAGVSEGSKEARFPTEWWANPTGCFLGQGCQIFGQSVGGSAQCRDSARKLGVDLGALTVTVTPSHPTRVEKNDSRFGYPEKKHQYWPRSLDRRDSRTSGLLLLSDQLTKSHQSSRFHGSGAPSFPR